MLCDKIIEDREFGHLYIIVNARAVRYTFRPANDGTEKIGVRVTVPSRYDLKDVLQSVERMRPQLNAMLQKSQASKSEAKKQTHIDWDFRIESDCLHISFVKGTSQKVLFHKEAAQIDRNEQGEDIVLKPAVLQFVCPPDFDFDKGDRQAMFERAIIEGVRLHAKIQLLPRLLAYANRNGIQLNEVKINSSKGRWGSCSLRKKRTLLKTQILHNINLSLFTLLLPMHLQKLILLHELTHTFYMDHSPAFHAKLDAWLGGKEAELEKELKKYKTTIFSFVKDVKPK
ncbi:MAG: DUF45 domain-containing protein [Bacteroidales bacterium]|nr:DUF45 domain-containing protein [Bacteroidales bacterium]